MGYATEKVIFVDYILLKREDVMDESVARTFLKRGNNLRWYLK